MKKISLANIQSSLETLSPAVEIDPAIADRARAAVERMLDVGRSKMTEVAA
jgi:quinolinate synthase